MEKNIQYKDNDDGDDNHDLHKFSLLYQCVGSRKIEVNPSEMNTIKQNNLLRYYL